MKYLMVTLGVLVASQAAQAHGIAGNRYFPGTLSFDDPAVADEFVLQPVSDNTHPDIGSDVVDQTLSLSFARLLTPRIAVGADGSWTRRDRAGFARQSGFGPTSLMIKGLVYEDDLRETLLSTGLTWRIESSGDRNVAGAQPGALEPGVFLGKGFGDLPNGLAWLRPFGVAGAAVLDFPLHKTSMAVGVDASTRRLGAIATGSGSMLHWGVALEYSTLYLTDRFTGELPTEEPLNQFVPLVELSFDSPLERGFGRTTGTINPGVSYVGRTYQFALEASVPMNHDSGRNVGARGQLLLFLDDLAPRLFGGPVFSRR